MSLIDGAASGTFSEAQGATIMRQMSRDEMVWPARRGTAVERAGCVPYEVAVEGSVVRSGPVQSFAPKF